MVVVEGRSRGGAGDVLLLACLAPHLVCCLVKLLVGSLQFRLTLALPPAGEGDLTGGAIGLMQRRLLRHIRVRRDLPTGIELLLRLLVLLEEMKVVGGVINVGDKWTDGRPWCRLNVEPSRTPRSGAGAPLSVGATSMPAPVRDHVHSSWA